MNTFRIRAGIFIALYSIDFLYYHFAVTSSTYPLAYFLAAITGVFTVFTLSFFGQSRIVRDMQIIHVIWIGAHAYGFINYMLYFPPKTYDTIQIFLHIAQIIRLCLVTDDDSNHIHDRDWFGRFRKHDFGLPRMDCKRENR